MAKRSKSAEDKISVAEFREFLFDRIVLIEDVNDNGLWDIGDMLQDEKSSFSSPTSVSLQIQNIPIFGSNHPYLLFLTFGQSLATNLASNERLNLSFTKTLITTSGNLLVNIAGLFPQPRFDTQISIVTPQLSVALLSVSPNATVTNTADPRIWLTYAVSNPFTTTVSITDLSPQFYQTKISSRNVTSQFRFSTLNLPVDIGPSLTLTFDIVASPHITLEQGNLIIDATISYIWKGQNIQLSRHKEQYWSGLLTQNKGITIAIPTYSITYLENPNYILNLERVTNLGLTENFRNGEMINAGDALKVCFVDAGQGIDLGNTRVLVNALTINANADQNTIHYTQDRSLGSICVGPLSGPSGSITLIPQDVAGNPLPQSVIHFKTNTSFFVQDFLPYPSLLDSGSLSPTWLQLGFLLSKGPSDITVYILNSVGELIWKNQVTYPTFGYQLINFNGITLDGTPIPRGLYLVKLIAKETGSGNQTRALTKFVVY